MSFYEESMEHDGVPQEIIQALDDKKICLALAHAACFLMAADPNLSPYDAALDTCQAYCCLLEWHSRQKTPAN